MKFHDKNPSFKAIVYFADGNKRTFYSRDFPFTGSKERKPLLGFARLEKMILKWGKLAESAIIYSVQNNMENSRYIWGYRAAHGEKIILVHPNFIKEREAKNEKIQNYRDTSKIKNQ